MQDRKVYTQKQALEQLRKFCVYRERSQSEVIEKLHKMGFYGDEADNILIQLIDEDFLNEQRFAEAFVSGKYKMKKWGRKLIVQKLKAKQVTEYCIRHAMKEIDEQEYLHNLKSLVEKKWKSLKGEHHLKRKEKTMRFAYNKGYETNLIIQAIEEVKSAS